MNNKVFRKKFSSLSNVLYNIEKSISEVLMCHIYKNLDQLKTFTHWDNWITNHWEYLKLLPNHGAFDKSISKNEKRRLTKWRPPPKFKFKLNYDMSF